MRMRVFTGIVLLCVFLLAPAVSRAEEESTRMRRHAYVQKPQSQERVELEIEFGREVSARILGQTPLVKNDNLLKYVNTLGKALAMYTERTELNFAFGVLDSKELNAIAVPGGYIFITKATIDRCKDEAELAGILAHEISHITKGHVLRELDLTFDENSAVSGVAALVSGISDAFTLAMKQAVDKSIEMLTKQGYRTSDELEADREGTYLLSLAGYDPAGLERFLSANKAFEPVRSEPDREHPQIDDRLAQMKTILDREGLRGLPANKSKERFERYVR